MVRDEADAKSKKSSNKKKDVAAAEVAAVVKEATSGRSSKKSRPPPPPKRAANDYYADMDLPDAFSDEEVVIGSGDEFDNGGRAKNAVIEEDAVEQRKSNAKELRKAKKVEQQVASIAEDIKRQAKLDDSEVFSVSVAGQSEFAASVNSSNMRDIKVDRFSVAAKGKELFNDANITIAYGRRYGLVGPNGKGKTTIMKLIARRMLPVPKNLDVLLVEQEIIGDERTAIEAVMQADEELTQLRQEEERINKLTSEGDITNDADANGNHRKEEDEEEEIEVISKKVDKKRGKRSKKGSSKAEKYPPETVETPKDIAEEDLSARLVEIHERMEELGGSTAISRASKILSGLGFTSAMINRETRSFSGGWRMRISIARALFMLPSVLLLDEPTNHLDLRAVLWLEEYLQRWKKTLVVVSHDRDFLNNVCTDIVHLHDMKLYSYRGNFDSFERMYEQRRHEQNKAFEKYDAERKRAGTSKQAKDKAAEKARLDAERRAKRSGAKKNRAKDDSDANPGAKAEPVSKWSDYTVNFSFPEPTELGHPLLQLIDADFQYPGVSDFKLSSVNVGVGMGTRAAIVGPNGAGKSTFINLLAGELEPMSGEFRRKQKLRVGRYSQHFVDVLDMDTTPVHYLQSLHPEQFAGSRGQQQLRGRLGRFGLSGEHHLTPIAKLSGGQKARVVFTMIALMEPHILLLDEPTNNLDMESIDALGEAIEEFSGGVVIISHDSRLISNVCEDETRSELWVVDDGKVAVYDGTFEDYRAETIREIVEDLNS